MKILYRFLRRYELRKITLYDNLHVSWHVTENSAEWKRQWWQDGLYNNDGERWNDGATYYVRRVGE